jgi:hypothetical protein
VIGGLLLATSAAAANALSPIRTWPVSQVVAWAPDSQSVQLHDRTALRVTRQLEDLTSECVCSEGDSPTPVVKSPEVQAIDLSSRYDGKTVPI